MPEFWIERKNFLLNLLLLTLLFVQNGGCDRTLWDRVYRPGRLKIIKQCVSVTGTVESSRKEKDGDLHIRLRLDLDPAFESLLNDRNRQRQKGCLVVEPICMKSTSQRDAKDACRGYRSPLRVPKVGTRVTVTGSLVLDLQHGWIEIHPASSISILH